MMQTMQRNKSVHGVEYVRVRKMYRNGRKGSVTATTIIDFGTEYAGGS